MAAEGKVSTFLCLITCSRVLFTLSRCAAAFNSRNGAKETSSGCFEGRKTFFGTVLRFCEQERASNVLSVTSSCFVVSARIVPPPARRVNLLGWGKILSVKNVTTKWKRVYPSPRSHALKCLSRMWPLSKLQLLEVR